MRNEQSGNERMANANCKQIGFTGAGILFRSGRELVAHRPQYLSIRFL